MLDNPNWTFSLLLQSKLQSKDTQTQPLTTTIDPGNRNNARLKTETKPPRIHYRPPPTTWIRRRSRRRSPLRIHHRPLPITGNLRRNSYEDPSVRPTKKNSWRIHRHWDREEHWGSQRKIWPKKQVPCPKPKSHSNTDRRPTTTPPPTTEDPRSANCTTTVSKIETFGEESTPESHAPPTPCKTPRRRRPERAGGAQT